MSEAKLSNLNKDIEDEMLQLFSPFLAVSIPAVWMDKTGKVLKANEPADTFFKIPITGHNIATLPFVEDLNISKYINAAIVSGWEGVKNEFTLDPAYYKKLASPVSFTCIPLWKANRVNGVVMQISVLQSQDKRADLPLNKRMLFEAFMENCPVPAWIADADCRLYYMNRNYKETFGLSNSDLNQIPSIFPPQYLNIYRQNIQKVIVEGRTLETIEDGFDPSGNYRLFKMFKFPIYTEDGKILVCGWMVDLTQLKETEQALRKSNERYQYASKATSDVIWEWDRTTETVFIGDGYDALLGYPKTTKLPALKTHVHPDDYTNLEQVIQQSLHNNETQWQVESRYICANGDFKVLLTKGFNVLDASGKLVKIIGALQDMTPFKELQQQLLLEQEESSRKWVEAVVLGQERERQKIGTELHDNVNQLLVTVQLLLQTVQTNSEYLEGFIQKSIDVIGKAQQEIRQLSHNLIIPRLKEVDFFESIQDLVDFLLLAGVKNVDVHLPEKRQVERLNEQIKLTLYRVIQEQISNIIKYAEATQVLISIEVQDREAKLSIKDDGIGFNPREKHKGIGLSNIHSRILVHKGRIWVNSCKGAGCELSISIPI